VCDTFFIYKMIDDVYNLDPYAHGLGLSE